eukprot:7669174-Heterocapsa_arctica.AAC.1
MHLNKLYTSNDWEVPTAHKSNVKFTYLDKLCPRETADRTPAPVGSPARAQELDGKALRATPKCWVSSAPPVPPLTGWATPPPDPHG